MDTHIFDAFQGEIVKNIASAVAKGKEKCAFAGEEKYFGSGSAHAHQFMLGFDVHRHGLGKKFCWHRVFFGQKRKK